MMIKMEPDNPKYALIKRRCLDELDHDSRSAAYNALATLHLLGVLDQGSTPESEFFVMRLRDKYASDALFRYSLSARMDGESDYARQIEDMAIRADNHPDSKKPD